MLRYRVKLNPDSRASASQNIDGYLGYNATSYGKVNGNQMVYTRGEAIKKAKYFGGKIELINTSQAMTESSITVIPRDSLSNEVLFLMKCEFGKLYKGKVFWELLADTKKMSDEVRLELGSLVQIIETDYLVINK